MKIIALVFKTWRVSRFMIYQETKARSHLIGLFQKMDFMSNDPSRKVFLVKFYAEIAGFVLLNQKIENSSTD